MTTWFVAREMAHAASVCRRFYWTKLNLWPDQLPRHTLVVLSERDELVAIRVRLACVSLWTWVKKGSPDDMTGQMGRMGRASSVGFSSLN